MTSTGVNNAGAIQRNSNVVSVVMQSPPLDVALLSLIIFQCIHRQINSDRIEGSEELNIPSVLVQLLCINGEE